MSKSDPTSTLWSEVEPVDQCAHMKKLAHFAFGQEVLRKVTNVIQPLNDRGSGPAFYCVHPITGSI
jgi:hypothetical protein